MTKGLRGLRCLGIIHVLAVEGHDVIEHALGLDSRAVGVKLYSANIVVDGSCHWPRLRASFPSS